MKSEDSASVVQKYNDIIAMKRAEIQIGKGNCRIRTYLYGGK